MTPFHMIDKAKRCRVMFGVANAPGDVEINITKSEAIRLVREHELPLIENSAGDEHIGSVGLSSEGVVTIWFDT